MKNKDNKFGLVYDNAIEENVPGQVNIHPVAYMVNGLKIAANVYTPAGYDAMGEKKYPAVTVAHPNGGVKEQVSGAYAQILAEHGYIAIAAEASYQGGSEGTPHDTDHPANRINDISAMVDFLTAYDSVDTERIGALGICGGGGYTLGAAQIDKRIKAVATLSMFNSGRVRRNGFLDSQLDTVQQRLAEAAEARSLEYAGKEVRMSGGMPNMTEEQVAKLPFDLYRDGYYYHVVDYAHPLATGRYTTSSLMELMAWDVEDRMDLIKQPLLMMAGDKADTLYMTEAAFEKAGSEDKELFLIEGATHIKTYFELEYVRKASAKMIEFFGAKL